MTELAESKPLYKITLIGGREIITSINMDLMEKAIAGNVKMMKAGGILINASSISTIEPYDGDDIDHYLIGIKDEILKTRLLEILTERKSKNLKTRGVKHLMQIYLDRFGEISDDKTKEG